MKDISVFFFRYPYSTDAIFVRLSVCVCVHSLLKAHRPSMMMMIIANGEATDGGRGWPFSIFRRRVIQSPITISSHFVIRSVFYLSADVLFSLCGLVFLLGVIVWTVESPLTHLPHSPQCCYLMSSSSYFSSTSALTGNSTPKNI